MYENFRTVDHYIINEGPHNGNPSARVATACGLSITVFPLPPIGSMKCDQCAVLVEAGEVA